MAGARKPYDCGAPYAGCAFRRTCWWPVRPRSPTGLRFPGSVLQRAL